MHTSRLPVCCLKAEKLNPVLESVFTTTMPPRSSQPLTKKELLKRLWLGTVITTFWLTSTGAFWWGLDVFRQRVKLVEDYGENMDEDTGQ